MYHRYVILDKYGVEVEMTLPYELSVGKKCKFEYCGIKITGKVLREVL